MPKVKLPDGSIAQFPDDMHPDDISRAIVMHTQQLPQAEDAPFSRRFLEGWGVTPESLDQPKPSLMDQVKRSGASLLSGGLSEVAPMIYGAGKNLVQKMGEGGNEMMEAVENIGKGQPVMPNIGKAAYAGENALMRSFPAVTPSVQNFGEDVYAGDPMAAAGSAVSAGTQAATMADRPGAIAPEYGAKLIAGTKTLPTVNPDLGGLAGGIAGHVMQPETGLSPFYGYMGGRVAARLANSLLESPRVNRGVGIALGGRQGTGGLRTLSPLEAGETTVPQPPPSTPPTGPLVPPLNEETLPAVDSPPLRGAPGRPPSRPDVPNLSAQSEMESPLGRGVNVEAGPEAEQASVTGPSLLDKIQSPLEQGESDIVPGNDDVDVNSILAKYPKFAADVADIRGEAPTPQSIEAFHGTSLANARKILQEGMKPADRADYGTEPPTPFTEGPYVTTREDLGRKYAETPAGQIKSEAAPEPRALLKIVMDRLGKSDEGSLPEAQAFDVGRTIPPENISLHSLPQLKNRAETVEDQGILDSLRSSQQTEGNRLLKQQFEDAGNVAGHEGRKGLYEAVTGLPASDFGEPTTTAPEMSLEDKLKASLRQVGGLADDIRPTQQKEETRPNLTERVKSGKMGVEAPMRKSKLKFVDEQGSPDIDAMRDTLSEHGLDHEDATELVEDIASNGLFDIDKWRDLISDGGATHEEATELLEDINDTLHATPKPPKAGRKKGR